MAQLHEEPTAAAYVNPSRGWAGWVVFAATMLLLIGGMNVIQGLVALFDEGYLVTATKEKLLLVDVDAWGVVMIVWGAIMVGGGLLLVAGKGAGRWFAIVVAFVSALLQLGFLSAYPIWSTIVIALDVFVIFALTARWHEARAAM
jgi:hypothetical protein